MTLILDRVSPTTLKNDSNYSAEETTERAFRDACEAQRAVQKRKLRRTVWDLETAVILVLCSGCMELQERQILSSLQIRQQFSRPVVVISALKLAWTGTSLPPLLQFGCK